MLRVTSSVAYTVYHKYHLYHLVTTIVYITTVHERTKEWTKGLIKN